MSGIIVQPTYNEIIDMYTAMGEPELTDDVLSKIRDEIFPLDKFRELIVNHKDRVHKRCGQEDAIPLGWHRNAHENTLGTLFVK